MNKENTITIKNLIYALLFLIFGIILLTSTEDLITIASKVVGGIIIIIGIVKSIVYIYMKGKLGDYNLGELVIGLLLISFGTLLVIWSSTLSFIIRNAIGFWMIFSGINRIILAISIKSFDKKGFLVYLVTALLTIVLGVLLITGLVDRIIGIFVILYAIIEIVNYIYHKTKLKNYNVEQKEVKKEKVQKTKRLKKGKVVDAIVEENK